MVFNVDLILECKKISSTSLVIIIIIATQYSNYPPILLNPSQNKKLPEKMYKVSLKIHRVSLRIKQNIQIQTIIKKHEQNLPIHKTTYLQNGIAQLDASTQFYIEPNHPIFSVYVLLIHEGNRKLVGLLTIQLSKYQINFNNQVHCRLEESPDPQSYITLQFGYTIDHNHSQQSSQFKNMQQIVKEMEERNNNLRVKNNQLISQLKQLKQTNIDLENGKNTMNDNYQKKQEISMQGNNKKLKVQNQDEFIEEMEEKMVKLKQLMDNFGGQDIRDRVHNIFKYQ